MSTATPHADEIRWHVCEAALPWVDPRDIFAATPAGAAMRYVLARGLVGRSRVRCVVAGANGPVVDYRVLRITVPAAGGGTRSVWRCVYLPEQSQEEAP